MRFPVIAAGLFAAAPAFAQSVDVPSGTYTVDPTHASVTWKVTHLGLSNYTGMFARDAIDATIELDAENVANSTLAVSIDTDAVRTLHPGDTDFNAEIASDMFLNASENPEITFATTGIEVTGDNTAIVSGELTLRGEARPFELETTLNAAKNHPMSGKPSLGISASGTLMRSEFGINSLVGPVSDEVTIEIEAEFQHAG